MSSDRSVEATDYVFDLKVYRLSALKKAVYRFMGQYNVTFSNLENDRVSVRLVPKASSSAALLNVHSLENEVIDQELRELVADETKSVRDLLLAQAFSGLALIDPAGETEDFHVDPLRISEPARPVSKRDT